MVLNRATFGEFLGHLFADRAISAKQIADCADVSLSTVYRWQRGQNQPDINAFAKLLQNLPEAIGQSMMTWLLKGLPVQVCWESRLNLGVLTGLDPEKAKKLVEAEIIEILSQLVSISRHEGNARPEDASLSQEEVDVIEERLDCVTHSLIRIKMLERKRLVRRKSAKN